MVTHGPVAAACHEEAQAESSEEEEEIQSVLVQQQSQQDHHDIHQEDDIRIEPQLIQTTGRNDNRSNSNNASCCNDAIIHNEPIEEGENTRLRKAARREPLQDERGTTGMISAGTAFVTVTAAARHTIGDSQTTTTTATTTTGSDPLHRDSRDRLVVRDTTVGTDVSLPPLHGDDSSSRPCLDIETALSVLLPDHSSAIHSNSNSSNNNHPAHDDKEWLSNDPDQDPKRDYLRFRVGHAGDAAALATFYNTATTTTTSFTTDAMTAADAATEAHDTTEEEAQASLLELRLADGFGDEQRPPAFYAILTHVCRDTIMVDHNDTPNKTVDETSRIVEKELIGAAVVTLEWCSSQQERVLNVEFFHVAASHQYSELIHRRLLLRLSALALATHCASLRLPPNI